MQNVENDMDDLFRRAAEKYPLTTGQNNWENIEKRLSGVPLSDDPKKQERKYDYKKWLLVFLFISISLLIGFIMLYPLHRNFQAAINENKTSQQKNLNEKPVTNGNLTIHKKLSEELNETNGRVPSFEKDEISPGNLPAKRNRPVSRDLPGNKNESFFYGRGPSKIFSGYSQKNTNTSRQKPESHVTENPVKFPETKDKTFLPGNNERKTVEERKALAGKNVVSSVEKKKPPSQVKPLKENGFYAGIVTGPDFSKVKSGSFTDPGFSTGILAGYKINKKFFIETGFLSDTKYYFSEGNMFNKAGASMPDEMIVNNLESRSKILEIPLKLGYRFYKTKKTNLFLTGGISTYIMTNERNNYNVSMNGNPEKMEGIYKKTNFKMPAVLSMSVGWEHHLSGFFTIRIEPYLKIPLQGIGVGKLPVTSTGVQIGITRQFK